MSSSGYSSYQQVRSVLALPQSSLLPINAPSAGSFGFHSKLPELQALFNQKHLAVLANVGTLVRATTRTQFRGGQVTVPQNLFSHEDQQAQMQTASLTGDGQTDGQDGQRTRFSPSMAEISPLLFRWRARTFSVKVGPRGRSSPVAIRQGYWQGSAARLNRRTGCQPYKICLLLTLACH